MTIGIALLIGSLIGGAFGHRVLQLITAAKPAPRLIITTWLVLGSSVTLTFITGVTLMAIPGHGGVGDLLNRIGGCWSAFRHGALPASEELAAAAAAAVLVGLVIRISLVAVRHARSQRIRRDKYRFLSTVAAAPGRRAHSDVLWLDHPYPIAFSIAGRPGLIAASRGLADHLEPAALSATLEHERAHLRGHHHLLLDVADIAAAALPVVALFRTAPGMMRDLVEMAADDVAVRRFGAPAVIGALQALVAVPAPRDGLAMAGSAMSQRMRRLERGGAPPNTWHTGVATVFVTALCAVLPAVTGVALLLSIACSVG